MTALSRRPDLQGRLVRLRLLVLCGMTTLLVAVQTAHLYGEARALVSLLPWFVLALALGTVGAVWAVRRLRAEILNLAPEQIAALARQQRAVLAALRGGVLAVDRAGEVTLTSARAALTDLWPELARVAAPGRHQNLELTLRGQPVLVNLEPLAGGGFVAVFRDRAEALALAEDLIRTPIERALQPMQSERMRLVELLRREEVKRPSGRGADRGGEVPDCWRNKRQSL